MNKTKVLHAITRLDRGGSSENTLLSAIGLARKGYDVDLLFGRTEHPDLRLLETARKAGVDFIEEEDLVRDIHPARDITAFFDILRYMRDKKYDIVHAHSSKAGLICRIAARMARVRKIFYTPHGHVFYGYFGAWLTRLILFAESRAAAITDKIIGLTPAECEEWLRFGIGRKEQYAAVPSGIDFDELIREAGAGGRGLREELGVPEGKTLVGSFGRFVDVKGHEYFIRAAADRIEKGDDVYFLLAGDGPLRDRYRDIISSADMSGRFHIIGWQDDMMDVISAVDIFVLPSLNEGMGRVLVEAMFFGKPVIATRVGGVPSVVTEDVGLLVDPASPEAISAAMEELLNDPERAFRMGENGRERAVNGYSAEKMVDDLDRLYREELGI